MIIFDLTVEVGISLVNYQGLSAPPHRSCGQRPVAHPDGVALFGTLLYTAGTQGPSAADKPPSLARPPQACGFSRGGKVPSGAQMAGLC